MKKPFGKSGRPKPGFDFNKDLKKDKPKAITVRAESPKKGVGKGRKKPKEVERKSALPRLNQYIAKAGICSRREADELIVSGKIKVNGKVVFEMGIRVSPEDKVTYNGNLLQGEVLRYVLLNKPKGYLSTISDPKGRKTVMELLKRACSERIYPVGRLDRDTLGLLLFTNDGDLAKKLTHPSSNVKKIYHVYLDKPMLEEDMDKLMEGVELEDGLAKPDIVNYVFEAQEGNEVGVQLHSGKNRIVRRMFEHLGYKVVKLDRVLFANLTKKDIPRGKWRHLTAKEVAQLKQMKGKNARMTKK